MGGILLFCISEEAKPFVQRTLNVRLADGETRMFNLVQSRTCPDTIAGFKEDLQDGETFETDFIGASVQDCQGWAMECYATHNFIEQDFIAIADERSATDGTLVVNFYGRPLDPEDPVEFDGFGVLPREPNTWVEWRIQPEGAPYIWTSTSLEFGVIEASYPVYLGRKEELTDENGVFNVAVAEAIIRGEIDPDTLQPQA